MRRLSGRGAAPGVALAPAAVVRTRRPGEDLPAGGAAGRPAGSAEEERERLEHALRRAAEQLRELAATVGGELGQEEAEIFEAHAAFAEDPELATRARAAVADGVTAAAAVTDAFGGFRALLEASDSEYLAARAADLDDVRDRVLTLLAGGSFDIEAPDEPSVIVAHELSPSQTASIPRSAIAALVTETGSPTSHAAILARALGVPAVVGVAGVVEVATEGAELGVDGASGEVLVDPDASERRRLERARRDDRHRQEQLRALRDEPGRTADGHRVELAANLGDAQDLPVAVDVGAEGAGLVRTEFLYLDRTDAPSVDEQAAAVERILRAFPDHRVVVRTLDVGADKPLPFLAREAEPNPALGVRGIRLSLAQPAMFRDQLRALLTARAAAGTDGARLAIMFPMVSVPAELTAARRHLDEVAAEAGHDLDGLEVGVMVETPAAALAAAELAAAGDFLSIGTNDLLQYLFAADRLVSDVADLADVTDPRALRLLGDVVAAAHAAGAWVGVCGEAAGDPEAAVALVGLGVDELSMTPAALPEVRAALRRLPLEACREAVAAARRQPDAASARAALMTTARG